MTRARVTLVAAALALVGALAFAAAPRAESASDRVERVTADLRCPVCQGLSVKDSPTDTARAMRDLVAQRIAEGRGDDEIRAEFRRSYGEWIFLSPDPAGPGALLWLLPLVLVGAGTAVWIARTRPGPG